MKSRCSVTVPASSGNLGPGFDVWGLALKFRNELHARVLDKQGAPRIRIVGEGNGSLPTDERNVIYKTMRDLFARAGQKTPKLDLVCVNRIPLARGLGSSSAAYLSALLAANRLMNDRFSKQEILNIATELEGHPDNVAPALFGGVKASAVFDGNVETVGFPAPRIGVVVAIPSFELSTKKARRVLPKKIPMRDAVSNLAAVSLMSHALKNRKDLLPLLLNDRWHEPYRSRLIPGFYAVKQAALKAGASGVILSGAGPTMLSFVEKAKAKAVASAMARAFMSARVQCRTMPLEIDTKGAVIQ